MEDRISEPHVNRVVGETIRPDVTVTHPGTLTEQNDSGLTERLALSSEPDPTDGYVTCTKLKEDNVKSEDPLSSDLGKISDLVEEEVHRLMEISEKMKEIEASDINMPQKALETKKSQYTSWDHSDGPTTMIYDTDLG